MHMESRDKSLTLNFCFIIGYPPYVVQLFGLIFDQIFLRFESKLLMEVDLISRIQKSSDRQSVAGLDEFYTFWFALVLFSPELCSWIMNT